MPDVLSSPEAGRRRRRSSRTRSDGSDYATANDFDELDSADEDAAVQRALGRLEQLDVEQWLAIAKSRVTEVQIGAGTNHHYRPREAPQLENYPLKDPDRHWRYASDLLEHLASKLPPDMLCSTEDSSELYSLSAMRLSLLRLYVDIPPERIIDMMHSVRAVYMWEDPWLTSKWLALYSFAWLYDIILATALSLAIYHVVRVKLVPPKAAQIQRLVKERIRAAKEAKAFGSYLQHKDEMGSIATSMVGSLGLAGLGQIQNPLKPPERADSGPDEQPGQSSFKKRSAYRIMKKISKDFGPIAQVFLDDLTILAQKVKNMMLWRNAEATRRVVCAWSAIALFLAVTPSGIVARLLWAYAGIHFFLVCQLQERYPQYRRALNPFFWALYGLPTDAEAALHMLQRRSEGIKRRANLASAENAAQPGFTLIAGSPHHTRNASSLSLPTSIKIVKPPRSRRKRWSQRLTNALQKREHEESGTESDDEGSSSDASDSETDDISFFACYKKTPGRLIIDPPYVHFTPLSGFSHLSRKMQAMFTEYAPSLKDMAALEHAERREGKSRLMLRLMLSDITAIKKEHKLVEGGALVIARGDESFRFTQMRRKRDEAFALLLACCPSHFVVA